MANDRDNPNPNAPQKLSDNPDAAKLVASVRQQVGALKQQLDKNPLQVIAKALALMAGLPAGAPGVTEAVQAIQTLIDQAAQASSGGGGKAAGDGKHYGPETPLENAVYKQMDDPRERDYYRRIDPKGEYTVRKYDDKGNLTNYTRTASGKEIRESFTIVEFHSMDETKQKRVLADLEKAGLDKDGLSPVSMKINPEDLSGVLDAVRTLRGMSTHTPEGRDAIHDKITAIIEKNQELHKKLAGLGEPKDKDMTRLTLEANKEELKTDLKKVLNDVVGSDVNAIKLQGNEPAGQNTQFKNGLQFIQSVVTGGKTPTR